jgi:hypothetical protein
VGEYADGEALALSEFGALDHLDEMGSVSVAERKEDYIADVMVHSRGSASPEESVD